MKNVYLQPGEYCWGDENYRIKTLLGSCVAICVWHPVRRIGGMSHCLLPSRRSAGGEGATGFSLAGSRVNDGASELSGKYVDETFEIFFSQMNRHATQRKDYQVKVFGGGNMFEMPDKTGITVGEKNLVMLRSILKREGMRIDAEHVGGKGHRNVIFELWNGDCWVKHSELP